ncbi:hypothetical protein TNCV_1649661 [Trichonephila clavipes]|nr:hypothetical protein TNCV_1649661 [Trichonephila clavipes]
MENEDEAPIVTEVLGPNPVGPCLKMSLHIVRDWQLRHHPTPRPFMGLGSRVDVPRWRGNRQEAIRMPSSAQFGPWVQKLYGGRGSRVVKVSDRGFVTSSIPVPLKTRHWLATLIAVPLGLGSNPGEDMDACKCIVPSRHGDTLTSRLHAQNRDDT